MSVLSVLPPYTAVLTREQFLFYETRTTARLLEEGLTENQVIDRIVSENLFQFPTEKMLRRMARTCLTRLQAMQDEQLVRAVATQPSDVAKQICLYAMMCQYRLVWEFILTVIGAKYRSLDLSFGKKDINGRGYSRRSLYDYLRFFRAYPEIVQSSIAQSHLLSWTHYLVLLQVLDLSARA